MPSKVPLATTDNIRTLRVPEVTLHVLPFVALDIESRLSSDGVRTSLSLVSSTALRTMRNSIDQCQTVLTIILGSACSRRCTPTTQTTSRLSQVIQFPHRFFVSRFERICITLRLAFFKLFFGFRDSIVNRSNLLGRA